MYNMQLNTGYAGKPHVTAENCADLNRGIVGSDSYVLPVGAQFEVELVTNNLLKIKDGCGCMQGRQVSIAKGQTDEITIENGTQGEKRIDLVVIRYSKNADTGIETAIPFLVKGIPSENNPVRPEHLEGDIRGGDLTADWPLYELYLDGISVTNVKPLFDVLMSVDSLNRKLNVSAADIISFTPLAGQNYPNWGGCYYYTSGSRVHVHLGIQALPANKVATVFVLPESVHPKTRILNIGPSGSFPGVARIEISLDGGINVTSQDTYAAADIEYDTYS